MASAAAVRLHKALVKNASSGTNYLYKYTREALASPTEGVAWSYAELNDRVHALVHGLVKKGFGPGDSIGSMLPNCADNVLLQLSSAVLGLRVVTVKDAALLPEIGCGGWVHMGGDIGGVGATLTMAPGASKGQGLLRRVMEEGATRDDGRNFGDTGIPATELAVDEFAQYGGVDAARTQLGALVDLGDSVCSHLSLTEDDVVCVPVNMNHTMGFGFGVVPAILAGASVVLPSTSTSVETTIAAMQNQACTILIADSHITKVLVADDVSTANAPSLRGGLVKVGSGETISSNGPGAVTLFDGAVTLSAVGTPR